ncbi:MAG: carboxypeptidase M32 [Anaerolineales bacterium]|nr:carboxypeptidase M32 [Anaerolineales bacterium]
MKEKMERFRQLIGEISDLENTMSVLGWDQQVNMPENGAEARSMQLATLAGLAHSKFVGTEMGQTLEALKPFLADLHPDSDEYCLISRTAEEYEKQKKVPTSFVAEFSRVTTMGQQAWEKAKSASDFSKFQPNLEKIIEMRREYAGFFAPYDHVYDPLLDDFEPGLKAADVRRVFEEIKPQQVELLQAIVDKGPVIDDSLLYLHYDEDKQWNFGVDVIEKFGFDFTSGRQDRSIHPFTTEFGHGDVRITTHFDTEFLSMALFGTMHEAGHAMYEQGVSKSLSRTMLHHGASLAVHESQSRMWENLVGRSLPFWKAFYPRLQELFPENLGNVGLNAFYRAVNKVEPSLIRIFADEMTYNLHIMLRFDLELAMMQGDLEAADLPEAWNSKMQEYLGITPPNDAKGVLQDVHWSGGMIGYFTTYALGNLIASMLWEKILEDIPNLESGFEKAEFAPLLDWLRENVHRHGSKYKPMDLVKKVTGKALTAEPYMRYLRSKFGEIYDL